MVPCPKCDAEVQDTSKPCPQCGHRTQLVPEWVLWVDIVLFILSLAAFFSTNSPLMVGVAFGTFLYMIFDLSKRNAFLQAVRAAVPADPTEGEGVEAGTEEEEAGPGELEEDEEEFIPEQEEESVCGSCGEALEEGAQYCGHCGRKQGP